MTLDRQPRGRCASAGAERRLNRTRAFQDEEFMMKTCSNKSTPGERRGPAAAPSGPGTHRRVFGGPNSLRSALLERYLRGLRRTLQRMGDRWQRGWRGELSTLSERAAPRGSLAHPHHRPFDGQHDQRITLKEASTIRKTLWAMLGSGPQAVRRPISGTRTSCARRRTSSNSGRPCCCPASPSTPAPIKEMMLQRFNGERFELFGSVLSSRTQ
jgi:hypothetical protein